MCQLKQQPAEQSLTEIYPTLYRIDFLDQQPLVQHTDESNSQRDPNSPVSEKSSESSLSEWIHPDILPLTAQNLSAQGVFLMDAGNCIIIFVGKECPSEIMRKMFAKNFPGELDQWQAQLPDIEDSLLNQRTHELIETLQDPNFRSFKAPVRIILDESGARQQFINLLTQDRTSHEPKSYYDFLMQIKKEIDE